MTAAPAAPAVPRRKTPWRDNIEALTVAIVMAVMLKYFIIEAYKIPTGSMQPTLMGNDETDIHDRILVDKLSYHLRDPERFEVVVFKYPLDRSKNFVKRLVGMPDEDLRIRDGDVWIRPHGSTDWKVLRRPRPVQLETWKRIDVDDGPATWRPEGALGGWSFEGTHVVAHGEGSAIFVGHGGGPIMDAYEHGYPAKMRGKLLPHANSRSNEVGDLRVCAKVEALEGCTEVAVELEEGGRHYVFQIPGPAAVPDSAPRIEVLATNATVAAPPYRLPAGRSVRIAAQNLDDLLSLEIDGDVVCELAIAPAEDQRSAAHLRVKGAGAELDDTRVYRDIYYQGGNRTSEWSIPPGNYFMLGDNTQDSSDSREWLLWNMRWSGEGSEGAVVRGNSRPAARDGYRPDSNPIRVPTLGEPFTFFRDEWGELHVFPSSQEAPVAPGEMQTAAPFVPRNLITGRALLVFWPFVPSLGVYRLKWVH